MRLRAQGNYFMVSDVEAAAEEPAQLNEKPEKADKEETRDRGA